MKKSKVKRAVIAAAGLGTRFLPHTKAVPKEMLPVINKPVIQLVVEDLVAAGVEEIIIVTNDTKKVVEDHFDHNRALEAHLANSGQTALVKELIELTRLAKFVYLRQKGSPGNARPLINAAHLLGNQPFFFYFADDFFRGKQTTAQQLLKAFQKTGQTVVAIHQPSKHLLSRYGVIEVAGQDSSDLVKIKQIIEKPPLNQAPSGLAVGGGYLFTPDVLSLLDQLKPRGNGELAISDAIIKLPAAYGLKIKGDYYDTGTPEAYLRSLIRITLENPDHGPALRRFLKKLAKKL